MFSFVIITVLDFQNVVLESLLFGLLDKVTSYLMIQGGFMVYTYFLLICFLYHSHSTSFPFVFRILPCTLPFGDFPALAVFLHWWNTLHVFIFFEAYPVDCAFPCIWNRLFNNAGNEVILSCSVEVWWKWLYEVLRRLSEVYDEWSFWMENLNIKIFQRKYLKMW